MVIPYDPSVLKKDLNILMIELSCRFHKVKCFILELVMHSPVFHCMSDMLANYNTALTFKFLRFMEPLKSYPSRSHFTEVIFLDSPYLSSSTSNLHYAYLFILVIQLSLNFLVVCVICTTLPFEDQLHA